MAAVPVMVVSLVLACGPREFDELEPSSSGPTVSSALPDETSADTVEPVPSFEAEEDLDLCLSPDELAALESLEHDGSFDYGYEDREELDPDEGHHSECRYYLSPSSVGDGIVTSEVFEHWIDVRVLSEESSWEGVSDSDLEYPRPAYFRDWKVQRSSVEVDESQLGICVEEPDRSNGCSESGPVLTAAVAFLAAWGNFTIQFTATLTTPDLEKDMDAWVDAVLTEITEEIVSRVPTE